ncbi:MAG: ribbon-helix-helix protein, CopG family [Nanoarchaeota archaeon]|nr:ribbon-helix-helix protein, CopG family [Nanoarchaeota archaeon]
MEKGEKTTQSIRISPDLWKEVKVHVAKTDTNISSFIEQALKNELGRKK